MNASVDRKDYSGPEIQTEADLILLESLLKVLPTLRPVFSNRGGEVRVLSIRYAVAHVDIVGAKEPDQELAGLENSLRLMLLQRVPGLKEVVFES
jgi:Fe-S cluster biogenesis protein NfuA